MENLLIIAISPVIILLIYVYIRDKYEKEPKPLALGGTFYGIIISFPIIFSEKYIMKFAPSENSIYYAFFISFIVASFVEEAYKYIILRLLIWKNKNYNEPFDAILYAVFVSLGFALIENILYVMHKDIGGIHTGIARAIFSVPAHAFFGVYMGYYLSIKKYKNKKIYPLLIAILIHGVYDILLFSKIPYNKVFFIIFFIYIFVSSIAMIRKYIKISPFRRDIKRKNK